MLKWPLTLNQRGIPCFSGSCSEVYLEKAFDHTDWRPATRLPIAQELGETSLMFLVHPTLTDAHIQQTCETLRDVMQQATIPNAESWSQTIIAEREDRV